VQRRVEAGPVIARDARAATARPVVATREHGVWRVPDGEPLLGDDSARILVEVPFGFVDMLREAPALAVDWRLTTRSVFEHYFARGYRVVDFSGDRAANRAAYLLHLG
jgi:predicted GNAT superfamily acetyltransferase